MEFEQCIQTRRSIRRFKKKTISRENLEAMVAAASQAPSWKNTQVTRYYAITNQHKKDIIAQSMPEFNLQACQSAAVVMVVACKRGRSGYNRDGTFATDKGKGWQMYDAALSNMLFVLKAHELGIGSVIMGYYDAFTISSLISLPIDEEVVCVIALGYPDETPQAPKRKSVEELLVIE